MSEQRADLLDEIRRDGAFDVLVVGGGTNGIGVYRELALQGLRVLLVERNDFSSGCSAAPSRMIHGGLRYLENGEFALVRESLRERDALLANAPHMVRPLPTTIPIRSVFSGLLNGAAGFMKWSEKPAQRGALAVKLGLALYDWTTRRRRVLPAHAFRSARATFAKWPDLDPALRFSATYYDAWISYPERLCIELICDTRRLAPQSTALNYVELRPEGEGFALHDRLSGETFAVKPRALVNAAGAWLDRAAAELDPARPKSEPMVEGTKGSHLILDNPRLYQALGGHMIFFENADGRVCIMFPYLGRVLVGATDIRVKQPGRVRCEPEEAAYILEAARAAFPAIPLSLDDVVYSYSGIRPLPKSGHAFTGRISRGHFIQRIEGRVPQFCMVGGKWTTFRAFAEDTADAVLAELGAERRQSTLDLAIGGGAGFPAEPRHLETQLVAAFGLTGERARHLVDRYGSQAGDVAAFCAERADDVPVEPHAQTTLAEIVYLARREFVVHAADIVFRRTALAVRGDISRRGVEAIASTLGAELNWGPDRIAAEIQAVTNDLSTYHGVSRDRLERRSKPGMNDEDQCQGPHEPHVHEWELSGRRA